MTSLHVISDDYYYNRISHTEYREQRTQLLNLIDEELNGVKVINENEAVKEDESFIDKTLSFLKVNKYTETN